MKLILAADVTAGMGTVCHQSTKTSVELRRVSSENLKHNRPPCSETYYFQRRYISYSYGGVRAVGVATIGFSHDGENSSNRIVPESPLNHSVIVLTERMKNRLFDLSLSTFCQTVALRFLRTNFWHIVTSCR